MSSSQGACYLLHIEPAYHHAAHYAGWTVDPARRIAEHLAGTGSPLVRAAVSAGHTVDLVLSVPGDRHLERRWHQRHGHGAALCPRCRARMAGVCQLRLSILTGGRRPRVAASLVPLWRAHR